MMSVMEPRQLYVSGHNHRLGYVVERCDMREDNDCKPVRFYWSNLRRVRRIVERFNRMHQRARGES